MEFQASKSSSPRVAQNTADLKQDERRRWYDIDELNNLIDRDFGPPETCPRWSRSYAYKWHNMVWAIAPKPVVIAKATNAEEFRAEMQSITIDKLTYARKMPEKYRADLAEKCQEFYLAAQDKENHVAKLDAVLTEMLFCKYHPREVSREDLGQQIDSFLCRQPPTVLPLPDFISSKTDELYFHAKNHGWDGLRVVSSLQQNLVRNIACTVIANFEVGLQLDAYDRDFGWGDNALRESELLITIGELLEVMAGDQDLLEGSDRPNIESHLIARSFLWTYWQRMRLSQLFFTPAFASVTSAFDYGGSVVPPRNFRLSARVSMAAYCREQAVEQRPARMCGWALQLLQGSPSCCGLDFRLLYTRYTSAMHHTSSRCRKIPVYIPEEDRMGKTLDPAQQESLACDGMSPDRCLRYRGLVVPDQSAHDVRCNHSASTMQTEHKISWDEASYRQVQGPKAVSIKPYIEESVTMLRYCAASQRTLAISHVWIHGQGGRPETGINQCLHQRYARIARNNDCDSYWMDTTCIPTDHDLRREAISHINNVFNSCAAALICDRDIMQLDVSQMTMVRQEEVLATLLLSDWNVRAWTLLESVKARGKILLLCKDDLVVHLDELMQNVCNHGRLDMAIFFHQLPHMLPLNHKYSRAIHETSIEVVASWLSCRPASRENDAVTIWSLLVLDGGKDPAYDAIDFWKSRLNSSMGTGFLLTSAPRLKIKGLRWAPSTPYAHLRQELTRPEAQTHRSLPGHNTGVVTIRKNGIWGQWNKFCFDLCLRDLCRLSSITCPTKRELAKIRRTYLRGYRYGALLRPVELRVAIEYSKTSEYFTPRIDGQGMLLVICGSNMRNTGLEPGGLAVVLKHQQPSVRWTWLAVYEWPIENVPLPEAWTIDLNFWIS